MKSPADSLAHSKSFITGRFPLPCFYSVGTFCLLKQGSPASKDLMPDDPRWSWCNNNKGTINEMCLNHPETIPLFHSMEKLSSTKLVPGARKLGDRCFKTFCASESKCFKFKNSRILNRCSWGVPRSWQPITSSWHSVFMTLHSPLGRKYLGLRDTTTGSLALWPDGTMKQ